MLKKKHSIVLGTSAMALAVALAFQHGNFGPISPSQAVTPAAQVTVQPQAAQSARALPDFSALVDQAGPAVVNISVVQKVRTADVNPGIDPSDPMFDFFRRFQTPAPQAVPQQGVGSGFIVSPDGYILTNAHVVADASDVSVTLTDKREYKAKVIGVDKRTDVALIKINGAKLPIVRIGDSSRAKVGEWVAAIGSPFGFENSVTAGIISAKARILPDETYVPFLQTDVAVNPGNSGGPLLNVNGEVIGINSQIYSRTGGYMGLSFAIPIEVAMKVKDDLQKFGKVSRGKLGVSVQPITQELATSFGLKDTHGALVNSVETDSPAARAGLSQGDVILAVGDRAIDQPADLVRAVGDSKPGETVHLKVWRKGGARDLTAKLSEVSDQVVATAAQAAPQGGKLGVAVRPLTPDEQKQLGTTGGLLVENVGGAAARAGLQAGDVILAVNNEQIKDVDQLRRSVEKPGGNSVALLVQRDKQRIYVPIKLT